MNTERKDTFRQRFDDYYPLLCRIAATFIVNFEECKDIVQETFISAWDKEIDRLPEKEFASYMVKAVKNNCISFLRRQKPDSVNIDELPPSSLLIPDESTEEEYAPSPEEVLVKILSLLPPKCKEVFLMSKLQKMKYKEIAMELNISEKTVENHIRKAIQIIREHISSHELVVLFLTLIIL